MERNFVIVDIINGGNKTQDMLGAQSLNSLNPAKPKSFLTKTCIDKYQ